MSLFEQFFKKGGKAKKNQIHINPKNEGKFSEAASRAGMGVQQYAAHVLANKENYDATTVRRANFARNAAKWKHKNEDGGSVPYISYDGTSHKSLFNSYFIPIAKGGFKTGSKSKRQRLFNSNDESTPSETVDSSAPFSENSIALRDKVADIDTPKLDSPLVQGDPNSFSYQKTIRELTGQPEQFITEYDNPDYDDNAYFGAHTWGSNGELKFDPDYKDSYQDSDSGSSLLYAGDVNPAEITSYRVDPSPDTRTPMQYARDMAVQAIRNHDADGFALACSNMNYQSGYQLNNFLSYLPGIGIASSLTNGLIDYYNNRALGANGWVLAADLAKIGISLLSSSEMFDGLVDSWARLSRSGALSLPSSSSLFHNPTTVSSRPAHISLSTPKISTPKISTPFGDTFRISTSIGDFSNNSFNLFYNPNNSPVQSSQYTPSNSFNFNLNLNNSSSPNLNLDLLDLGDYPFDRYTQKPSSYLGNTPTVSST